LAALLPLRVRVRVRVRVMVGLGASESFIADNQQGIGCRLPEGGTGRNININTSLVFDI